MVQTDLKENGNLPAEFNVNLITAFKVEVKVSQSYINDNGGKTGDKVGGDVPSLSQEEQDATQKDGTINVQVNIAKLTDRQRRIYEEIKNGMVNVQVNVQVNVPNLAASFNVSEKTIRRDLYVLRDMNLIQYVGSDKTGHWEVVDKQDYIRK